MRSADLSPWLRARGGVWLLLVCAAVGTCAHLSDAAEEETPVQSTRSRQTTTRTADAGRATRTSDTAREARVEAKLDQLLAYQERILTRLNEVMEELKIVKIRATVR